MPLLEINKKLLPMKIHYFIGMAGAASIIPFLTTVSKQRGYSSGIVGLIFSIIPIPGLLIKPAIGVITDKYKCRKSALITNAIFTSVLLCIMYWIPGTAVTKEMDDMEVIRSPLFWFYFISLMLLKTVHFMRDILEDTICVDLLGKDRHKYGNQRVWGAIGWGVMSFISGACVDWYSRGQEYKDYTPGFVISLICFLLDIYVVSKIKVVQNIDVKIETFGVKKLFTEIQVLVFLLWVIIFGIFNAFIWYYVFLYMEDLANIYHPETKPWIKTIQGFSNTIQCWGGEVPFFFLSGYVLKRMDHMHVFSLMFFTFSVRFFLYSVIKNPVWVLPVELLNGITFALAYSAAISYAAHLAPVGVEGTFQGIVGTASLGIGLTIGCFVGGYLFGHFGSITLFKLLSYIALVICIIQIIVTFMINRYIKNKDVKDEYDKVKTEDIVDYNITS